MTEKEAIKLLALFKKVKGYASRAHEIHRESKETTNISIRGVHYTVPTALILEALDMTRNEYMKEIKELGGTVT